MGAIANHGGQSEGEVTAKSTGDVIRMPKRGEAVKGAGGGTKRQGGAGHWHSKGGGRLTGGKRGYRREQTRRGQGGGGEVHEALRKPRDG